MKRKFSIVLSLVLLLSLVMTTTALADGPSISSDLTDYGPGDTVTLTGTGWGGGEEVHIVVNDDEGQTWNRDVYVFADENGVITDSFSLPTWFVATYYVTATGASGTATTTFTDGNVASVSGTITDLRTGSAISGATVVCTTTSGCNANLSTTTDASGFYVFDSTTTKLTFNGNSATLTLTASMAGYASGTVAFSAGNPPQSFTGKDISLKPVLTVTASSPADGVVGDPKPTITPGYGGFEGGDDASVLTTAPTCGTTYTQGSPAGDYPTTCSGGVDDIYAFAYVAGNFHVDAAPSKPTLTVTASSPTGFYGDPVPTITPSYSGFVGGDDASVLDTAPSCSTTYAQGDGPGDYPTNCSGGVDDKYDFSYVAGNFQVDKAPLKVTASSPASGHYGDSVPTITPSYNGFVLGEDASDLTTAPSCTTTYTQGSAPGDYPTSCSGGVSDNYAFTYVAGNFHVDKAPLTVTASSPADGVYGADVPTITPGYSGFVLEEDASDLTTAPTCSTTYTHVATSGPGDYPTSCSGGVSANYEISYVDGNFHVGKAMLTVTADNLTKILNAPNPTLTFKYGGFVYAQDASVVDTPPSCTTTATTNSPVGTYPIACSGGDDNNYDFSYVAGTLKVMYADSGLCLGAPGHAILQPINAGGDSVFKQKSTVPAKFRVCDANGVSIGPPPDVVSTFKLVQVIYGTESSSPNEDPVSTTPDTAFRWSPGDQQWIFNINTKNLSAGRTYVYLITLNDGSTIQFQFGLK